MSLICGICSSVIPTRRDLRLHTTTKVLPANTDLIQRDCYAVRTAVIYEHADVVEAQARRLVHSRFSPTLTWVSLLPRWVDKPHSQSTRNGRRIAMAIIKSCQPSKSVATFSCQLLVGRPRSLGSFISGGSVSDRLSVRLGFRHHFPPYSREDHAVVRF